MPAGDIKPQHLPGACPAASLLSLCPQAWVSLAGAGAEPGGLGGRGYTAQPMAAQNEPLPPWASTKLAKPSCTGKSTDLVVTHPVYPCSRCIYHACRAGRTPGGREQPCKSCTGVPLKVSSYQTSSHQISSLPLFPFLGCIWGVSEVWEHRENGHWGCRHLWPSMSLSCHHHCPSVSPHPLIPFLHPAPAPERDLLGLSCFRSIPEVISHPGPVQPVHTGITRHTSW